jgi:predicted nucleotide-binding protein
LHNNETCAKKREIASAKSDGRTRIAYAYDWSTGSINKDLIRNEVKAIVEELKQEYSLRFLFVVLRGKDGSIFCDICRQIRSADVGLFDISTHNLNVILELGLATGTGMPVFILRSTQYRRNLNTLSDLDGILEHRFYTRKGHLTFKADFRRSLKSKLLLIAKKKQMAQSHIHSSGGF